MSRSVALLALLAVVAVNLPATAASAPVGELTAVAEQHSQAYRHVRYVQTIDGIPVQDAGASEHVPLDDGEAHWTQALVDGPVREAPNVVGEQEALAIAREAVSLERPMPGHEPEVRTVWTEHEDQLVQAREVHLASLAPPALWRVTVDAARGDVLDVEDRSMHLERPARAFDVNPIVALQQPGLRDNPASVDNETLSQARTTMTIANLTDGPTLATDTFRIVDSATDPRTTDNLTFRREDPRFVEAQALAWLQHGVEALRRAGYADLVEERIDVFVHQPPVYVFVNDGVPPAFVLPAAGGPDAYSQGGSLHFHFRHPSPGGQGMGSSAEDADVVLHELGHELLFAIHPQLSGDIRTDLHEAFAMIYGAALQPRDVSEANRACEAEWMVTYYPDDVSRSHEGYPCLRVFDNDLTMADFDREASRYANAEILAGAVYDLAQRIGWNATRALVTEAAHLLPEEPASFHVVGNATARADCALTDCVRLDAIQAAFGAHGIEAQPPADAEPLANGSADELESASTEDDGMLGVPAAGAAVGLITLGLAALAGRRH